jgi:hypothetical protein
MRLGHEQRCEEIHRGGGAEQYHAEKKYKEAVAVAVAKCADDTCTARVRRLAPSHTGILD